MDKNYTTSASSESAMIFIELNTLQMSTIGRLRSSLRYAKFYSTLCQAAIFLKLQVTDENEGNKVIDLDVSRNRCKTRRSHGPV